MACLAAAELAQSNDDCPGPSFAAFGGDSRLPERGDAAAARPPIAADARRLGA